MGLETNAARLEQQLNAAAACYCGSEAVVKLRTSLGVRVDRVSGSGEHAGAEESALAGIDRESTFLFSLRLDQTLKEEDKVYLQFAALYTNPDMRRLVRVHNLCLIASSNHTTVFRHADLVSRPRDRTDATILLLLSRYEKDAVVATLAKMGVEKALCGSLYDEVGGARTFLNNQGEQRRPPASPTNNSTSSFGAQSNPASGGDTAQVQDPLLRAVAARAANTPREP